MIGQKQKNNVFVSKDVSSKVPTVVSEIAEETTASIPIKPTTETPPVSTGTRTQHNLFFTPEIEVDSFSEVLRDVQEHISGQYSTLISDGNAEQAKIHIKRYVNKYVIDKRIAVKGMTQTELVNALYTEMAEFSFLTKYIFGSGIEEIDINAWNDIEIQYSGGRTEKLDEHFDSPEHAINVVRRMLHVSGVVLDNASPLVTGTLAKNIRIAVLKTPIVDEDVGIAASIRIVNPQNLSKDDFVNGGTATEPMLDFLSEAIRYGISVCIAGATSSGKTTVAGWLLTTVPNHKRIFTIENGSRELSLIKTVDGKVVNSVIHTQTRDSENDRQRIDQVDLSDIVLRFNPSVVAFGEMRGAEANTGQEIARTGVVVITTVHANSSILTYPRMISLCKRAVDMSDETLMNNVTEAYPLVVFCKQLENKQRKIMEIMECEILPDGTRNFRSLFQYQITENKIEDGKFIIEGSHCTINAPSDSLCKRLLENGMPIDKINKLKGGIIG